MTRRPVSTRLTAVTAACQACPWTQDGLNGLPLAARHYDTTGHPVTIELTRRVHYGTAADLDRARHENGQTTLIERTAP